MGRGAAMSVVTAPLAPPAGRAVPPAEAGGAAPNHAGSSRGGRRLAAAYRGTEPATRGEACPPTPPVLGRVDRLSAAATVGSRRHRRALRDAACAGRTRRSRRRGPG